MAMDGRARLKEAKRIVVKVGSSTLTHKTGKLNLHRIEHLVRDLAELSNEGREVILVSSGAQAAGMGRLGLAKKPADMPGKQALAAIGQGILLHIYEKFFAEYGKTVGQVLLTKEDAVRHNHYHHSRNALFALLEMGAIPIINENDAISVDEFQIGDNDNLSAIVATLVDADALVILSDIEGLYTANPQKDPSAALIHEVPEVTPSIERIAGGAGTCLGTGGMMTKIQAAKIAGGAGVTMAIVSGLRRHALLDVLAGAEVGTVFPAREDHLQLRRSWLAFGKRLAGDISVDAGCERALREKGASILAVGITDCAGEFPTGSTVRILSENQQEIARGIVNYDSEAIRRLMGHQTEESAKILGAAPADCPAEVIHRDNMVLMV